MPIFGEEGKSTDIYLSIYYVLGTVPSDFKCFLIELFFKTFIFKTFKHTEEKKQFNK